eukprot:2450259-Rhodomonas_salina.2
MVGRPWAAAKIKRNGVPGDAVVLGITGGVGNDGGGMEWNRRADCCRSEHGPPHSADGAWQNDDSCSSVLFCLGCDAIKKRDGWKVVTVVAGPGRAAVAVALLPGRCRESVDTCRLLAGVQTPESWEAVRVTIGKPVNTQGQACASCEGKDAFPGDVVEAGGVRVLQVFPRECVGAQREHVVALRPC